MPRMCGPGRRTAPGPRGLPLGVAACAAAALLVGCQLDAPGEAPRSTAGAVGATRTGTAAGTPGVPGTGRTDRPGRETGSTAPAPTSSAPVLIGTSGTPAGGALPSAVDGRDAVAVSRAVVQIKHTMDTAIDASAWDAELRAERFLAPEYAAKLRANPPVRSPGGEWMQWDAHQAYTTCQLESADETGKPEDTPFRAFHAWHVAVTATGRDGWTGQSPDVVVYVVLERANAAADWKVTQIDTR